MGLWCALSLAAAALLLSACGGSSSTDSAAVLASQRASTEPGPHTTPQAHDDIATSPVLTHRPLHGTGGNQLNDENPGGAHGGYQPTAGQSNPCALISKAQAQAIIGRPIKPPLEAPLGPTCIYQPVGAQNFITVTVEALRFATVGPHILDRTRIHAGGHAAYCGTYGQPTTFIPLAGGRVLDITAPCAVGVRFAAAALPRMKAVNPRESQPRGR